jgi:putative acetyltransferase
VNVHCRRATASDAAAIVALHRTAFSTDIEADLVASLIVEQTSPTESWVAEIDGAVVGHVLLTPGHVPGERPISVWILCPLAVLPSHQNAGVGTAVTRAALGSATDAGACAVCVFGDPDYYARFGFRSLLPAGPMPPYDVAPRHQAAWQTLLLSDDAETRQTVDGARIQWQEPLMVAELWQA